SRDAPRHPNPVVRGDSEQHDEPGPLHDGGGPDVRGRSQVGAAHGPPRDGAGDGPRGLGRDREGVSPGQRLDGRPSPPGTGAAGGDRLRVVETDRGGVGGTFDLLHAGHEARLRAAFDGRPEAVVIGLTTDRFAKESRTRVNPYVVRERNLKRFLAARKWRHARIEPIDDPYGPADD